MIPKKVFKVANKIIPKNTFTPKFQLLHIKDGKLVCTDSFILFEFEPKDKKEIEVSFEKVQSQILEKLASEDTGIDIICTHQLSQKMVEFETYEHGRIILPTTEEKFIEYDQKSLFGKGYEPTQKILPSKQFELFIECCRIIDPFIIAQSTDIIREYKAEDENGYYTIIYRKYQE